MSGAPRPRAAALLLVVALAAAAPAMAQQAIRVDGSVMWIAGQTLTLALDPGLAPMQYQAVGPYLVLAPGPRPTVSVDLHDVPQSDYAAMRPGEWVTVIGVASHDRRRLLARTIIRDGTGQQAP